MVFFCFKPAPKNAFYTRNWNAWFAMTCLYIYNRKWLHELVIKPTKKFHKSTQQLSCS